MIIQCPACSTRYVVPETAIGVEGRTVRCAKCRHSWFQDGAEIEMPDVEKALESDSRSSEQTTEQPIDKPAAPIAEEPVAPEPSETFAQPAEPEPSFQESTRETVVEPPVSRSALAEDSNISHFDAEPPFRRRRNPLKMWSWAAGIFAVVAAGLIFSVSFFGLPDWVPVSRPTFAASKPDLQLNFPQEQQERRKLPNGTEFFGASGSVTNIGTETRSLPTILIVLRDARDRVVYSWEVPPPQSRLAPGESVTVNEAVTDIPTSARSAEIGWKPE